MPQIYDEKWFEKQLRDYPPERYKLTVAELSGLLSRDDTCATLTACYNYGFRRGRNFERNVGRRKRR